MELSKLFIRELSNKLKDLYPKSKGRWVYGSLLIKPFKSSEAEFLICFDDVDNPAIITEYYGFDWDAKGSNTAIVDFPQSKDTFKTVDGVISFLKECTDKYIKDQQEFYDEGVSINKEWEPDTEEGLREAKILASLCYPKGFLKEIGVKE